MKSVEINGETFKVIKSKDAEKMFDNWSGQVPKNLYNCYEKPSTIKKNLWTYWEDWAIDAWPNVSNFGISSFNTFAFSLMGLYWSDDDEPIGILRITKSQNILYMI